MPVRLHEQQVAARVRRAENEQPGRADARPAREPPAKRLRIGADADPEPGLGRHRDGGPGELDVANRHEAGRRLAHVSGLVYRRRDESVHAGRQ